MLVSRYIIKEISVTLCAVTAVLLFAFLSNQLVRYLSMAASGKLPGIYIFKLMFLVIPQLTGLLLPLGLFFAILLALGRLYVDNEMTVLSACGLSRMRVIGIVLSFASVIALLVAVLNLWVGPYIAQDRQRLLRQNGSEVMLYLLNPGHFQQLGKTGRVVYVQDITRDRSKLKTLFAAVPDKKSQPTAKRWSIVTAQDGQIEEKPDGERYFVAHHGALYKGMPGDSDYQASSFDKMGLRLTQSAPTISNRAKSMFTSDLFKRHDAKAIAELQWRFSIPIMTLILAGLAVILSEVKPRQGKYAKMFPATLLLIAYANLLFVLRGWVGDEVISPYIGMWPLHVIFIFIALGLLYFPNLYHRFWPKVKMR